MRSNTNVVTSSLHVRKRSVDVKESLFKRFHLLICDKQPRCNTQRAFADRALLLVFVPGSHSVWLLFFNEIALCFVFGQLHLVSGIV